MRNLGFVFILTLNSLTALADYQSVPFDVAHFGQAIGYLDIKSKKGLFNCTGFLDENENFITNHHCIENQVDCDNAVVTFINQEGTVDARYACSKLLATSVNDREGIDLSVLKLDGDLWGREHLRYADLTTQELNNGTEIFITKFNFATMTDGQIKPSLDVVRCFGKVDSEQKNFWKTQIEYQDRPCAIKMGNSGSPFLNSRGEVIGVTSSIKSKESIQQLNRFISVETFGVHLNAMKSFFNKTLGAQR